MTPMELYLASKSPRRHELLQQITSDFTIINSTFDEREVPLCDPEEYVKKLAYGKATHTTQPLNDGTVIIGCDTIVVSPDNTIFGKPKNNEDGFMMLKKLSGKTHSVITGVCLYSKSSSKTFAVKTLVTFYPLLDEEIRHFLSCGEYTDKAGAYGIQGKGALLCQKIEGDYFNVVGLPIATLARELNSLFPANNV